MEELQFLIPTSVIISDYGILSVKIKYFSENIKKLSESNLKSYKNILKEIIENYIAEEGVNSNTFALYNKLFEEFPYFFTYRPKFIGSLSGNKILMQVWV